mmetsp:Transcript_25044/g.72300  ORF Transcript_25044/g.72300 Transcript_25044/m.72300 type:complete len:168 (+) Transcript_25044:71-574(+)
MICRYCVFCLLLLLHMEASKGDKPHTHACRSDVSIIRRVSTIQSIHCRVVSADAATRAIVGHTIDMARPSHECVHHKLMQTRQATHSRRKREARCVCVCIGVYVLGTCKYVRKTYMKAFTKRLCGTQQDDIQEGRGGRGATHLQHPTADQPVTTHTHPLPRTHKHAK